MHVLDVYEVQCLCQQEDREKIAALIEDTLRTSFAKHHQLNISALHHQTSSDSVKNINCEYFQYLPSFES